ncbi:MAG: hypothetical protein KC467_12890 [Marinomonas atlantica]|nr:hypothetical protein [Marinomonas atlantica]
MPTIGIFWYFNGNVIGRSRPFQEGECSLPGLWDTPDNHIDLWEHDPDSIQLPNELRQLEYQSIPRGRILYDQRSKTTVVYMDKTLFNDISKIAIRDFFQLQGNRIKWCRDPHYQVFYIGEDV